MWIKALKYKVSTIQSETNVRKTNTPTEIKQKEMIILS